MDVYTILMSAMWIAALIYIALQYGGDFKPLLKFIKWIVIISIIILILSISILIFGWFITLLTIIILGLLGCIIICWSFG